MASRHSEARAAVARRRASECLSRQNDSSEVASSPLEIQTSRLRARYDFSPAVAAVIAELAFPAVDNWRRA